MYEPNWVHSFRYYGLRLSYIVYLSSIYLSYCRIIQTTTVDKERSQCESVSIWLFRVSVWPSTPLVLCFLLTVLFYKTPPVVDGKHDKNSVGDRITVEALILRIVTIGKYRQMIGNAVSYHSDLIKEYLNCRFFSIHVVTENPLGLQEAYPDVVTEIVVPREYKPKSASLAKARNLAYWSETRQLGDLPEDRTWIIDIDEDVILTRSFMKSLCEKFLKGKNERKIGLPQVLIKCNDGVGYLNKLLQIHRFSFDLALHWPNMVLLNWAPYLAHGGCFVARADCSMDKNAECGKFCSMSEDNSYILSMRSKNVKLEFIDGWFREDAPSSFTTAIMQKLRWQRGHFYVLWHSPVARSLKIGIFLIWLDGVVLLPLFTLARFLIQLAQLSGRCGEFSPVGAGGSSFIDLFAVLVIANHTFSIIYGSWYLLSWREAIAFSLFALTGLPLLILVCIGAIMPVLSVHAAVKEMSSGKPAFKVTEKVDKQH